MPAKKRRSPEEKKRLSYSRDRRNTYGENDKSSRKNIARNKRARHHAERRRESALLTAAAGPVDENVEELVDERVTRRPRADRWRKVPDTQLGLYVAYRLKRRADKGNSAPETERARIEKILRNTDIDGMEPSNYNYARVAVGPEAAGPRQLQHCTTMAKIRASYYPARTGSSSIAPEDAE